MLEFPVLGCQEASQTAKRGAPLLPALVQCPLFFLLVSILPLFRFTSFLKPSPQVVCCKKIQVRRRVWSVLSLVGCFSRNRSRNWKFELFISLTKGIWGQLRNPEKYMVWLRKQFVLYARGENTPTKWSWGGEQTFLFIRSWGKTQTLQLSLRPRSSLVIRRLSLGAWLLRRGFYQCWPWLFIIVHFVLFNSGHMRAVMGKLTCSSLDSR